MTLLTCLLSAPSFLFLIEIFSSEEQRLRLHHLLQPRGCGPGSVCSLTLSGREEDRPEARHPEVQEQSQQDKEDLRGRRQSGDLSRGGEGLLQSVR